MSANATPDRYREVSVTSIDGSLTAESIRDFLMHREVYRRTQYVVLRSGSGTALAQVRKSGEEELFSPVNEVDVLSLPGETAWVDAPGVDTSVPSQLARTAREQAPEMRCVVVHGKHSHVSFLLDPQPVLVRVVDVAPPYPAKLADQAQSLLDVADEWPPVELASDVVDLTELARSRPAGTYLLPCRGSGIDIPGAEVHFLDERPPERDWLLIGCTRSREIHRWFYGRDADCLDFCPQRRSRQGEGAVLTKCCLLEEDAYEFDEHRAVVPWGASLHVIRAALGDVVSAAAKERDDRPAQ